MRKLKLVRVGNACPEAYDVYEGDVQVGPSIPDKVWVEKV